MLINNRLSQYKSWFRIKTDGNLNTLEKKLFRAKHLIRPAILMLAVILTVTLTGTVHKTSANSQISNQSFAAGRPLAGASEANTTELIGKNETIYGILNNDGSIESVEVVNHIYLRTNIISDGTVSWSDYGSYSELINLLDERQPELKTVAAADIRAAATASGLELADYDDLQLISWQELSLGNWQDIYYQGSSGRKLPWSVSLKWLLDGKPADANSLAGASGQITLSVSVEPDRNAPSVYRDSFMLQISIPLTLSKVRDVEAEGASSMITGRTRTLAYNILPGQSGDYEISFTAEEFSMDPVQITALPANIELQGFDSLVDGVGQIRQGQEELADGSGQLAQGISEMLSGMDEIKAGLEAYNNGGSQIADGLAGLSSGLSELKRQMETLAKGGGDFAAGLDQYAGSGQQVLQGYTQLTGQLSQMRLPEESRAELEYLMTLPDMLPDGSSLVEHKELATSLLSFDSAVSSIEEAMNQLNSGLGDFVDGASMLTDQYGQLYSGISALGPGAGGLSEGFNNIRDGFNMREQGLPEIIDGIDRITTEGGALPPAADAISNGQNELATGLLELETAVSSLLEQDNPEIISFAAPGLIKPDSVQFLIRTKGID